MAAQQAEDEVHQGQEIVRGITVQSFHYKAPPEITTTDSPMAAPPIGAYPSQAERTLAKYDSTASSPSAAKTPYERLPRKCFGCGAPSHGFKDRDGNITCPYGHDPTIKANAERELKAFREHLTKR